MAYIKWTFSYSKLFKLQQKIQKLGDKNPRQCRNFQRILRRSHLIQLLLINEILFCFQFQIKQSTKQNFSNIQKYKKKIIGSKLIRKKYCTFLKEQLIILLWVLAFAPLVQQKRNYPNIYAADNSSEIYETLYRFLQKPSANYIFINQFSNLFQNKYAILSNLLIEKKFFLSWLKIRKQKSINILNSPFFNRLEKKSLIPILRLKFIKQVNKACLNNLIINFINLNFLDFFENEKIQLKYPIKTSNPNLNKKIQKKSYYFFQYNNRILITLEKKKDVQIIQTSIKLYAKDYKLNIVYQKFFNINKGLNCFGWFFIKKSNRIWVNISEANFKNHQYEIKKYLQTTQKQSIDTIIYELNKKIISWQKFYNLSKNGSKNYHFNKKLNKMNDFLFWQIWYWIKKRYKNKSPQWLYKHYWKYSTSKNWIFSTNNEILIFYKN